MTTAGDIEKRIFIVGCPRSGTTLLQNILMTHEDVHSFIESHAFPNTIPGNRYLRYLGLASRDASVHFDEFLDLIEDGAYKEKFKNQKHLFYRNYLRKYIELFDQISRDKGKKIWVEKTPRHLKYISRIKELVTGARFIHIMRNGEDVVASMYDATNNYPQSWDGARDINQCIERWKTDIEISLSYLGHKDHIHVRYNDLIQKTDSSIAKLADFMNLDSSDFNLKLLSKNHDKIAVSNEKWKNNYSEIVDRNSKKIHEVFNDDEKILVDKLTSAYNEKISDIQ